MWTRVVPCMQICERFHPAAVLSHKFVCKPCANPKDINPTSVFVQWTLFVFAHETHVHTGHQVCKESAGAGEGVVVMISEHYNSKARKTG